MSNSFKGAKYDSDLRMKDIAALIRKHLKNERPDCKFSVRVELYAGGGSITISLMKAPFEAFAETCERGHMQLNYFTLLEGYHIEQRRCNGYLITKEAWQALEMAVRELREYNRDESDSMSDYFSTNFYMHVEIGQWNKPFEVTNERA